MYQYTVQCSLQYTVQCTVYSVQCSVYSVQCTLYSTSSDIQYLDDEPLVHGLRVAVAAVGPAPVRGDVAVLDLGGHNIF